jgi:capsular polysaccharide biosynthesis protein
LTPIEYSESVIDNKSFNYNFNKIKLTGSSLNLFRPPIKISRTESFYKIPEVVFFGTPWFLKNGNRLFLDSRLKKSGFLVDHTLNRIIFGFDYRLFDFKKTIQISNALILNTRIDNYYHWHFDVILKLIKLNYFSKKIKNVIMLKPNLSFQIEMINYFKNELNFLYFEESYSFKINNSYVIETLFDYSTIETISSTDLSMLNDFSKNFVKRNKNLSKIIYISREKSTRSLKNEKQFKEFIIKIGGEVIHFETMSVKEQYNIVYNAELIISVHGAGLINLIAAREGTTVIEITNKKILSTYFYHLANNLCLNYYQYMSPTDKIDFNHDLFVNLIDFEQKFGFLFNNNLNKSNLI